MTTNDKDRIKMMIDHSILGLRQLSAITCFDKDFHGVAITLDEEPILIFGEWSNEANHALVAEIIENKVFHHILNDVLNLKIHDFKKELVIAKVQYKNCLTNGCLGLIYKHQIRSENDPNESAYPVIGIAPESKHFEPNKIAIALCLVPELESIFRKYIHISQPDDVKKPLTTYS